MFFEAARNRRLVYQRCSSCGERIFYPRTVCPACTSPDLEIADSAGHGVVHSFTTQYRAGHPSYRAKVPYTVALIDLNEGVRLLSDLVDCLPEDIEVGMPVTVLFDDVSDELTLPRFRPANRENDG